MEDALLGAAGEPPSDEFSDQPFDFLNLPIEIRRRIYRQIAISRIDCRSHPRLWRPLGVDGGVHRIGYFDRDTVIPLLLTSHQIHDEAAAIVYGENTFAFHISGLAEGPIWFLEWLPPKYIRLLRKVYIRTGYRVDTYGFRADGPIVPLTQTKMSYELAASVSLMRQAWPKRYKVTINKDATVAYPADEDANFRNIRNAHDWPASSYHLWKMFVTDSDAELPRIEFKRIEWGGPTVQNMRPDRTRLTFFVDESEL